MLEMENILKRLKLVLEDIKIKYVIVGGIAVIHYGFARTTRDIDLIIEDNPSKFSQLISSLNTHNFDVLEDQFFMGYKEKTHVSIFDKKTPMWIDLKVAQKKMELDVLNNAIKKKIFNDELYIAPLEYVLIGKLVFMGDINDESDSDLLSFGDVKDFLTLYYANKEKIDMKLLTKKALEMRIESRMKRLLSLKF